jgi:hypothetical protein
MSWISGVGLSAFCHHKTSTTLALVTQMASALADQQLKRRDMNGLIFGDSTTFSRVMLSDLLIEHVGSQPRYAHACKWAARPAWSSVNAGTPAGRAAVDRCFPLPTSYPHWTEDT